MKRIVRSDKLRKHMESIPEGRTFKCEMYFKTFITSEELDKHTELVHEGRKLKCSNCLKTFVTSKVDSTSPPTQSLPTWRMPGPNTKADTIFDRTQFNR